jgi:hypothetical protein
LSQDLSAGREISQAAQGFKSKCVPKEQVAIKSSYEGGEMTQTMYAHVNKRIIKNKKKRVHVIWACKSQNLPILLVKRFTKVSLDQK